MIKGEVLYAVYSWIWWYWMCPLLQMPTWNQLSTDMRLESLLVHKLSSIPLRNHLIFSTTILVNSSTASPHIWRRFSCLNSSIYSSSFLYKLVFSIWWILLSIFLLPLKVMRKYLVTNSMRMRLCWFCLFYTLQFLTTTTSKISRTLSRCSSPGRALNQWTISDTRDILHFKVRYWDQIYLYHLKTIYFRISIKYYMSYLRMIQVSLISVITSMQYL